jgi:hypothetical protein
MNWDELDCHPQTVRERMIRFNQLGVDGLQDAGCAGTRAQSQADPG